MHKNPINPITVPIIPRTKPATANPWPELVSLDFFMPNAPKTIPKIPINQATQVTIGIKAPTTAIIPHTKAMIDNPLLF